MRLDKYLKVSRLIKRRTVANEACDGERVTVKFAGQTVETAADAKGDWIAKLQPLQANGEPAELMKQYPGAAERIRTFGTTIPSNGINTEG